MHVYGEYCGNSKFVNSTACNYTLKERTRKIVIDHISDRYM